MDQRNIKVPCRKCPDRTATCHAECEKYLEYKKKLSELSEGKYKRHHADEYLADYRKKRRRKDTLEKKRKGSSLS